MNSELSLLGAFVFLVIGVILQALLARLVYPLLSAAHEKAKAAGRRTIRPSRMMLVMRVINFLVLPLVGLLTGGAWLNR